MSAKSSIIIIETDIYISAVKHLEASKFIDSKT